MDPGETSPALPKSLFRHEYRKEKIYYTLSKAFERFISLYRSPRVKGDVEYADVIQSTKSA